MIQPSWETWPTQSSHQIIPAFSVPLGGARKLKIWLCICLMLAKPINKEFPKGTHWFRRYHASILISETKAAVRHLQKYYSLSSTPQSVQSGPSSDVVGCGCKLQVSEVQPNTRMARRSFSDPCFQQAGNQLMWYRGRHLAHWGRCGSSQMRLQVSDSKNIHA